LNISIGVSLDREKAMVVLKEMIASINCCQSDYVALMPPNAGCILSKGYQIHIKTNISDSEREIIEELLKKNGLSLSQSESKLIIYRPK